MANALTVRYATHAVHRTDGTPHSRAARHARRQRQRSLSHTMALLFSARNLLLLYCTQKCTGRPNERRDEANASGVEWRDRVLIRAVEWAAARRCRHSAGVLAWELLSPR